jgi:HSP20 family protein
VKVEIADDALVLEGERKFEREENRGDIRRTELQYGHFYRSIPLPEGANAEQAHARFENGVLEITIPVPQQESNRRQIPVEASSTKSQKAA